MNIYYFGNQENSIYITLNNSNTKQTTERCELMWISKHTVDEL